MSSPRPDASAAWRFIGVLTGVVISLAVLALFFSGPRTRFEDAAILDGSSFYAVVDGVRIHCTTLLDAPECIDGARRHHAQSTVLWLGNSQLHAINQFTPGDTSATELLHRRLAETGDYLVTFSEPNASLQEHLVLFAYLLPRLSPRALILPVVFDDFRESGIRRELLPALEDPQTVAALAGSAEGRRLLGEKTRGGESSDDFAGLRATLQERSERTLNDWLTAHWSLWADRPEARGQFFVFLYDARNTLLGIRPTTVRKLIPARFAENRAALQAIVDVAARAGVRVYLYIAPIRNDVSPPYDAREYAQFKVQLTADFLHNPDVTFADLENVVPNRYWGTKTATSLGGEPEYDFMHFQSAGHRFFADAMYKFLTGGGGAGR